MLTMDSGKAIIIFQLLKTKLKEHFVLIFQKVLSVTTKVSEFQEILTVWMRMLYLPIDIEITLKISY